MASIFTKILAGELPGHFVWKDDQCFSIMTIQPLSMGHLLVIPNEEVDHWDDVPAETAAHMMKVGQKLAKAIKTCFPAKRIGVVIAGIEVPHTHIHLFPVNQLTDFDFSKAQSVEQEALADAAQKIRNELIAAGNQEAQL